MKNKPLISVILSVNNNAKHVGDCIGSLLEQSEKRIEIIAVDDFSRDNSFKILKTLQKNDKRLKVYRNIKKYGLATSLNRALKKAKGNFIALANANDINRKSRLKKQLKFLTENPKIVAVGTQCATVDQKQKTLDKTSFPDNHSSIYQIPIFGQSFNFETVMIDKKTLPKDFLRFKGVNNFIYLDMFMKFREYGEVANLKEHLVSVIKINNEDGIIKKINNVIYLLRVWFRTVALYDYRPSFRSLFLSFSYVF